MLVALFFALYVLIQIMEFAILARSILSWVPNIKGKYIQILYEVTDPVLKPIRMILSKIEFFDRMMIDFSPIAAIIILMILSSIISRAIGIK